MFKDNSSIANLEKSGRFLELKDIGGVVYLGFIHTNLQNIGSIYIIQ